MLKSLVISALSILSALSLHAEMPDKETVTKHMDAILGSAEKGDLDTLAFYTHPNIIKMMGGREAFDKAMGVFVAQIKNGTIAIVSSEKGEGEGYYKSDTHELYYVRTKVVMKLGENPMTFHGIQLGIKALDTKDWKYIDIANKPEKQIRTIIPNIPEKFVLPKVNKEFFDKKKKDAGEK